MILDGVHYLSHCRTSTKDPTLNSLHTLDSDIARASAMLKKGCALHRESHKNNNPSRNFLTSEARNRPQVCFQRARVTHKGFIYKRDRKDIREERTGEARKGAKRLKRWVTRGKPLQTLAPRRALARRQIYVFNAGSHVAVMPT